MVRSEFIRQVLNELDNTITDPLEEQERKQWEYIYEKKMLKLKMVNYLFQVLKPSYCL